MTTAEAETTEETDVTEQLESEAADIQLSELERKHYEAIKFAETDALEAEGVFLDAKSEAKAAKEIWERKVERLRQMIRQGLDPQQELPFEDEEHETEAWKSVLIVDVLELTDKQKETLAEAGIVTVEQFETLRAGEGITSLPGVGQTTSDKWEDQMLDWLATNAREDSDEDESGDDDEEPSGD